MSLVYLEQQHVDNLAYSVYLTRLVHSCAQGTLVLDFVGVSSTRRNLCWFGLMCSVVQLFTIFLSDTTV